MYDDSFVCTYHLLNNDDSTDELYQIQFLQALDLQEWDDDKVNKEIDATYADIKNAQWVMTAISRMREGSLFGAWLSQLGYTEDDMVFRFLFGYDYFYLTHRCISETRRIGSASDEACDALLNKL